MPVLRREYENRQRWCRQIGPHQTGTFRYEIESPSGSRFETCCQAIWKTVQFQPQIDAG